MSLNKPTPIEIDFLRLFAELDNNNQEIDFQKLPNDDQEFERIYWSYYPNIDHYKLHLDFSDWKGIYIEINNHMTSFDIPIIKKLSDLLISMVFGFNREKVKELQNEVVLYLKSL
jgi:hypothetical protein